MSKYIDADKLKTEIERRIELLENGTGHPEVMKRVEGVIKAYNSILDYIKSQQQEQPKVDLVAKLKHHFDTTPKEQLEKEWKKLEHWNNVGPTVHEFLYGKQPEVDLEKEIEEHAMYMPHGEFSSDNELLEDMEWARKEFRHFYELGKSTRKEE